MQTMMRGWSRTALAVLIGAAVGWSYWNYFGCTNGCAITSSPVNSALYGALIGGLLVHSFKGTNTRSTTNPEQH